MRHRLNGYLAALVLIHGQAGAQIAHPQDVSSIDGIIRAYYEVVSGPPGGVADVARDRTLHHPEAWVAIAGSDSLGHPAVNVMTLDEYHGENPPRQEGFWEWETDRTVSRSGNMVHVWSSYASARSEGGEPYTHGVNSITLFHDGDRWWIMGWMFDSAAVPVTPELSADRADDWIFDGSGSWGFEEGTLVLSEPGIPGDGIRRPAALALLKQPKFRDVIVEAEVRSTADPSIEVADVLLVFGYQSATRFYYVHLSGKTDAVHNGIFVVDGADRRRIDAGDGIPQLSDREWHRVRLSVSGESGRIEVFVDDATSPGLVAVDRTITHGMVGFGSFDDTALIRNARFTGIRSIGN